MYGAKNISLMTDGYTKMTDWFLKVTLKLIEIFYLIRTIEHKTTSFKHFLKNFVCFDK